jgi:hypothetical protein
MHGRYSSIRIVSNHGQLSAFIPALAKRLQRRTHASVTVELAETGPANDGTALDTLLHLEKMVLRRCKPCWSDRLTLDMLRPLLTTSTPASPSLVIDLAGTSVGADGATVLRPLYDGHGGELALASTLLFKGTPQIMIASVAEDGSLSPLAEGVASLEAASGIGGSMEAVWSRVSILLDKVLAGNSEAPPVEIAQTPVPRISPSTVARYGAKMVATAAARAAYRLCCHAPHWRVGWRPFVTGQDVWTRRNLGGARWNVLRDPIDHFYADPFPFSHHGRDFVFFEDLDHKTGKGIISVVSFNEDGLPGPTTPVLEEPWHLSYPFLIEHGGQIWMIPEASLSGEITIYRAVDFPYRWERHGALLSGLEAADATIVEHDGLFYMFAVVREGTGGYSDTLSIWHARTLFGPWTPHDKNPVMVDDRAARPAGNFVIRDGALMRPVQDCRNGYGAAMALARVDQLSVSEFKQTVETHLAPGKDWPGRKLHTLNANLRLEVIDGSIIRPKIPVATRLVDHIYRP